MTVTVTTRAVKGAELDWPELDANFEALAGGVNDNAEAIAEISPPDGAGPLFLHPSSGIVSKNGSNTLVISGARPSAGTTLVEWVRATNNGPYNGYGKRYGYVSYGFGAGGFDLAKATVARWERTNPTDTGGQCMTDWLVAIGPKQTDPSCSHRLAIAELNVVYRGIDYGWQSRRSNTLQSGVFLQIVPEAQNFSGQADPGTPKNVLAGFVYCNAPATPETDALGYRPRMYNAHLGEPNSIHETGYAIYWSGSDGTGGPGGGAPVAFARLAEAWQSGVRFDGATFTLDPVVFGTGYGVRWLDESGNTVARQTANDKGVITTHGVATLAKRNEYLLYRAVANPAGVVLTADGGPAVASNTVQVPQSGCVIIKGTALARSGTPMVAGWTIEVLARRNSANDVTILGSTITKLSSTDTTDWALAAEADDTLGAVSFKITGTGSFNIQADLQVAALAS